MEFSGRYLFATDRAAVWAGLNDTAVLKATIPGCESITWSGANTLDIAVKVNLGLIHPVFGGTLTLSNVEPASAYTLSGHGKGGLLGLAQGSADVVLSDDPKGTVLDFKASGGASGQIMKMGQALIGKSAQRIIDGFFERFAKAMGTTVTPLTAPDASGTNA